MYSRAVLKVLFFHECNEAFKSSIVPMLMYRVVEALTYVYVKHDYADEAYFVARGTVKFIDDDIIFRTMLDGSHFGDFEVMEHISRQHSVRTEKRCEFLIMSKEIINTMKAEHTEVYLNLKSLAVERNTMNQKALDEIR
jgi:CRP-like cAMP-binding protein